MDSDRSGDLKAEKMNKQSSVMDHLEEQVTCLFSKEKRAQLPIYFLRAHLVFSVVSLALILYSLQSVSSLWGEGLGIQFSIYWGAYLSGLILLGAQIVLVLLAIRWIERRAMAGVWITLGLSVLSTISLGFSFFLGLFGLFSILNPEGQKIFLQEAPEGFKEFLSTLGMNWIK